MILDFKQADIARSLSKKCDGYCNMLRNSDSTPEKTFQEWLLDPPEKDEEKANSAAETGNGNAAGGTADSDDPAALITQWKWLCGIMSQSKTHQQTGLAELLALGLAMTYYDKTREAPSDKRLKQDVNQLARSHSQLCVLRHAETLLASPKKEKKDTLEALQKLLKSKLNAHGTGPLRSCEPAQNVFNGVCKDCRVLRQQKYPLLLKPNQTSYARILLDTYAEMQQLFLQQAKTAAPTDATAEPAGTADEPTKIADNSAKTAKTSSTEIPKSMVTGISALNKRNPYASAVVIWQELESSPNKQSLVCDHQVLRHGVVSYHASLQAQMERFGQQATPSDTLPAEKSQDAASQPEPSKFFQYYVYKESSPALYIVRQRSDLKKEDMLSCGFLGVPSNGELFSLYVWLFFKLYDPLSKIPTKYGYTPLTKETQKDHLLDLEPAFSSLYADFPEYARKAGLNGAEFSDFIDFLGDFAAIADGRNLLAEVLATEPAKTGTLTDPPKGSNPATNSKNTKKTPTRALNFGKLTFDNLNRKMQNAQGSLNNSSVWEFFTRYWEASKNSSLSLRTYHKKLTAADKTEPDSSQGKANSPKKSGARKNAGKKASGKSSAKKQKQTEK